MIYLAHTANLQLAGFAFATVGWILSSITTGLVQWRVWHVANTTIITSGIAWIGIWRSCFFSDILISSNLKTMYCQEFSVQDSFVPREIFVAQGLMLVAVILGFIGKVTTACALKNVYQGIPPGAQIVKWFIAGGVLNVAAGVCILIPVAWNLNSVVHNFGISFPSTSYMPTSPLTQDAGAAIPVGIVSAILMILSGTFFLCYKLPAKCVLKVHPVSTEEGDISDAWSTSSKHTFPSKSCTSVDSSLNHMPYCNGISNDAFELNEYL
ncbi:claudin-34 [Microcaecilia unicolor]|uniref:Claudin-34 n=1 Tax=Microcaecilia unicolor TaxID=1415580 RepID=A0A6P7XYB6_9AMPH|nr:claudin-34 [Microcaecilia unicolor]